MAQGAQRVMASLCLLAAGIASLFIWSIRSSAHRAPEIQKGMKNSTCCLCYPVLCQPLLRPCWLLLLLCPRQPPSAHPDLQAALAAGFLCQKLASSSCQGWLLPDAGEAGLQPAHAALPCLGERALRSWCRHGVELASGRGQKGRSQACLCCCPGVSTPQVFHWREQDAPSSGFAAMLPSSLPELPFCICSPLAAGVELVSSQAGWRDGSAGRAQAVRGGRHHESAGGTWWWTWPRHHVRHRADSVLQHAEHRLRPRCAFVHRQHRPAASASRPRLRRCAAWPAAAAGGAVGFVADLAARQVRRQRPRAWVAACPWRPLSLPAARSRSRRPAPPDRCRCVSSSRLFCSAL